MQGLQRTIALGLISLTTLIAAGHSLAQGHPDVVWQVGSTGPGAFSALAFSPDGSLIACGRWNGAISLLRASDGAGVGGFTGNAYRIYTVAFSPDGALLASGSASDSPNFHTARLWRVSDRSLLYDFSSSIVGIDVFSMAFSPDGGTLACASPGDWSSMGVWDWRSVALVDVASGTVTRYLATRPDDDYWDNAYAVAFSPDGSVLAAGSYKRIWLWRTADYALARSYLAHSDRVSSLAFASNGSLLASGAGAFDVGGGDHRARLWRTDDGSLVHDFLGHSQSIEGLAFIPDGSVLVSCSGYNAQGSSVAFWNVASGEMLQMWQDPADVGRKVTSVAVSPDGAAVAYLRSDGGGDVSLVLARNPYRPPHQTVLSVPDAAGGIGQTVQLAARLTALGAGVAGKTITFRVHGADAGQAVTDASGWALLPYVVPEDGGVGNRLVEASFAGDGSFAASDAAGALSVKRTDTKLFMLERSASSGDVCFLKGYLYRSTDRGWIGGRSLAFSVDGSQVGTAVTDAEGRAVLSYMVPEGLAPGPRPIGVSWAGDADYYSSSTSSTLTVTKGSLYIWVLQPRMASVGGAVYLRAYVRSWPGLNWKPGLPIVFSVEGTQVGTDITNADGRASVLYTVPAEMAPGDHPFTCDFPGNATYDPASGGGILTVTP